MKPERWRRIEALFLELRELAEDEREAFLARECADDAEAVSLLREMLERGRTDFLEPVSPQRLLVALRSGNLQGRTLAEFELEDELGRGGMGVVYRARQVGLDRPVAVKVLPPPLEDAEQFIERFRREALAASKLQHPGVVHVITAGEAEGLLFYAMELVDGWSLQELMIARRAGHPVTHAPDLADPRVAAGLCQQLALALDHAHERGVLHRDVKPQNVLVQREDGSPRLIDFGLARIEALDSISRTGELAGTPLYMSPEQVRALPDGIDKRTDVYSAGAVLYELLTGSPPYPGKSSNEVMIHITQGLLRPIRRLSPAVPSGLARACEKALERDPEDRYDTAGELADDLGRALRGERVHARPSPLRKRVQRRITRRALLVGAPPAVVLGVAGGYLGRRLFGDPELRAAPPQPRPAGTVDLELPTGATLRLWCLPWEGEAMRFSQPLDIGQLRDAGPVRLPVGELRLVLLDETGRFAELARELSAHEALVVPPARLAGLEEVREGMALVPDGGPRSTDVRWEGGGEQFTATRLRGWSHRPRHEAFWVDEHPVTNAEYRTWLEDVGEFPPREWPEGRKRFWTEPRRADWDDLPVTDVTWYEARAYAEWAGKRLPTYDEMRAATGLLAASLPESMTSPEQTPFNLGKSTASADWNEYLAHVRPVVGGDVSVHRPFGLVQPFGNVWEWLESAGPMPGARCIFGGAWHDPVTEFFEESVWRPGVKLPGDPSCDVGFRCAKSAAPPGAGEH